MGRVIEFERCACGLRHGQLWHAYRTGATEEQLRILAHEQLDSARPAKVDELPAEGA